MKELIDIFRMEEISKETRVRLLIKMGNVINHEYSMNVTEPIVYELVKILDPGNKEVETSQYLNSTNP